MAVKAPPPAPPPPAPTWTGFYIGGHVGGGENSGDLRADYLPFPHFGANPTLTSSSAGGFLGGFQAGYNWQFAPTWVVGVEGDFSWTRMNSDITVIGTTVGGAPMVLQPTSFTRDLHWLASARARFGYTVTPNLLLYATGGAAWGRFSLNGSFFSEKIFGIGNDWNAPFDATSTGYVVGGGAEWLFAPHWMLRAEYLFYRLDGKSNLANNPEFLPFPILFSWNATDTHVGRVAMSYKF
jgi:outer membrane immunogenic protein